MLWDFNSAKGYLSRTTYSDKYYYTDMISIHNSFWFKYVTSDRGIEVKRKRVEEKQKTNSELYLIS